ncbi:putative eka-like protein [Golovinomyces cichoracearum]|uniref:Putative eka-like protein n=1 Tax=Golovinomyces cichoracearum TaxID=62708 RepID=A0A420IXA5_9PEZI|nr:putative eka-like protein [Golovinomyces cichoracearum]
MISQINAASISNTAAQAQTVPAPTPVTLPPNNHLNPAVNRKPRKFQSWNGELQSFNCFLREVEDCIEIDRELMGLDRAVWFGINSSLPVNAKQKRTFGNKKEKEDKQEVLANLKQKETQNFSDFFHKFNEALAGSGGQEWTEDSKVFWLRRSLSESLKDQLFTVSLDPDNYYGSVRTIEEVAYRFERSRQFKANRGTGQVLDISPTDRNPRSPRVDSDGDVIMNRIASGTNGLNHTTNESRSTIAQGQVIKNKGNGRRRAALVDGAELNYCKANNLCHRCGTNAHYVAKCLYLPPTRPETQIRATLMNIAPKLEDESEESDELGEVQGKARAPEPTERALIAWEECKLKIDDEPTLINIVLNKVYFSHALIDNGFQCYAAVSENVYQDLNLPLVPIPQHEVCGAFGAMTVAFIRGVTSFARRSSCPGKVLDDTQKGLSNTTSQCCKTREIEDGCPYISSYKKLQIIKEMKTATLLNGIDFVKKLRGLKIRMN